MWFFSFAAVTSLKSEASALADRNFSTKQTLSLLKNITRPLQMDIQLFICCSELSSDSDSEKFEHSTANFFETSNFLVLKLTLK